MENMALVLSARSLATLSPALVIGVCLCAWPVATHADTAADAAADTAANTTTGADAQQQEAAETEPGPLVSAEPGGPIPDIGGRHWRIDTARGPVHVWHPDGYVAHSAGVVFYVHGYYTDVDTAWTEHRLAEQFKNSGRNALFIAPRAPRRTGKRVRWRDSDDLLRTVTEKTGLIRPWGPIVAAGHSGAYRTLLSWLDDDIVDHLVILDGMYRGEARFREWLERPGARANRMTMIVMDTIRWTDSWVRELAYAHQLDWLPEKASDLSEEARTAQLLYIRSQYDHMAIVESGAVIPVLLQTTRLPTVGQTP